jgi:inosine-uridine nucleoside N-ribohydrolase
LGPLTNLGKALQQEPGLVNKIESVYIMGGAVNVAGNLPSGSIEDNLYAEWNIFLDPHAASIVFQSEVAVVLVPLDATNYAPIRNEFIQRLTNDHATNEADFVHKIITKLQASTDTIFFWDPLAAVIATDRSIADIQTYPLVVVTGEGNENGRTRTDMVNGHQVEVSERVTLIDFENLFIDVLNGTK